MTEQLDQLAEQFVETFKAQGSEQEATRDITLALEQIAEGDEEVFLNLRRKAADKIRKILESQLPQQLPVQEVVEGEAPVETPVEVTEPTDEQQ